MTEATFRGYVSNDGTFTLDPIERAKFRAYAKRFLGEECEITFRKRRTKRSERQNRAFHAAVSLWAREEGHDIEELKDCLLEAIFGLRESVNPLTGEVKKVLAEPHTSTLDTRKFAELMERTVELAAGCGVILELPDEWKARKRREARAA